MQFYILYLATTGFLYYHESAIDANYQLITTSDDYGLKEALEDLGYTDIDTTLTRVLPATGSTNVTATSMESLCAGLTALEKADLSGFNAQDTDPVNVVGLFRDCTNLTEVTWGDFYIEGATVLYAGPFFNCGIGDTTGEDERTLVFEGELKGDYTGFIRNSLYDYFDLSATDFQPLTSGQDTYYPMNWLFDGCQFLKEINLAGHGLSSYPLAVSHMFTNCFRLETVRLGSITVYGNNVSEMFMGVGSYVNKLTVTGVLTTTALDRLFYYCKAQIIDLQNLNVVVENITSMLYCFYHCDNLTTIIWNKDFSGTDIPDTQQIFTYSTQLVGGHGTVYNAEHVNKEYARVDRDGEAGYFTKASVDPDPDPDITFEIYTSPEAGGGCTYAFLTGHDYQITAIPNYNYMLDRIEVTLNGRFIQTSILYTFVFRAPQKGNYVVTAYFVKADYVDPYNPSTPLDQLTSDKITDGKPTGWMEYADNYLTEVFIPTQSQLQYFADALFGRNWDGAIDNILGFNLTDLVHSLSVVPCAVPSAGNKVYKLGWWNTGVSMRYTEANYVEIDCGSIRVSALYGSYLDYLSNIQIYLPFIGYVPLENYDVIEHNLNVVYQIDLVTTDCVCKIYVDGSCKYQFKGTCGYALPVIGYNSLTTVLKTVAQIGAIGAAALTGSTTEAMMIGASSLTEERLKINRNRSGQVISQVYTVSEESTPAQSQVTPYGQAKEAIGIFSNMGSGVSRGTSLGGNTGFMSLNTPYLLITRPRVEVPSNFGHYNGFPCNKELYLGSLRGFTAVDEIHLEHLPATHDEIEEIYSLLRGGVII